eukprot:gb/GECH01012581.1/.p1 GENE.gb/GECH01012581.1/~~gb/GECH01012581.1/.p1  ORF type:complete len:147 (+),score=43.10 gb/GECH01012581.1/:1-441(+)
MLSFETLETQHKGDEIYLTSYGSYEEEQEQEKEKSTTLNSSSSLSQLSSYYSSTRQNNNNNEQEDQIPSFITFRGLKLPPLIPNTSSVSPSGSIPSMSKSTTTKETLTRTNSTFYSQMTPPAYESTMNHIIATVLLFILTLSVLFV